MNTPATANTPQPQHTPTITASIGSTGASFHYNNVASHPLSFRIEYRSPELSEEGQQLAAFIVRACNSHAQLVAALKWQTMALEEFWYSKNDEEKNWAAKDIQHAIDQARAALANLEK